MRSQVGEIQRQVGVKWPKHDFVPWKVGVSWRKSQEDRRENQRWRRNFFLTYRPRWCWAVLPRLDGSYSAAVLMLAHRHGCTRRRSETAVILRQCNRPSEVHVSYPVGYWVVTVKSVKVFCFVLRLWPSSQYLLPDVFQNYYDTHVDTKLSSPSERGVSYPQTPLQL